jgi:hypothetical protein
VIMPIIVGFILLRPCPTSEYTRLRMTILNCHKKGGILQSIHCQPCLGTTQVCEILHQDGEGFLIRREDFGHPFHLGSKTMGEDHVVRASEIASNCCGKRGKPNTSRQD